MRGSIAKKHLEEFTGVGLDLGGLKPLVLFDRGYPSKDIIRYLEDKGLRYVMRVQKGFNSLVDEKKKGSKEIKVSEGMGTRAIEFRLNNGEREALITNVKEEEIEEEALVELYNKRWSVETKYRQAKEKLELENISGRLVENNKQDYYAMMTVSNMPASCLREVNEKLEESRIEKGWRYEYHANVNHAVGVLKDRLIGILIADDEIVGDHLYRELAGEVRRWIVPIRPNRKERRKKHLKKPHFHHNHKSNC